MFNENDVRMVASELIDNAVYWDNGYENAMNPHDGYCCKYCSASEYESINELKHDTGCVVLVAKDLLT